MNETDRAVIHSSSESNWRTPDLLFYALDAEFQFYLDAAAISTDKRCFQYLGPDHEIPELRDALNVGWYEYLVSRARFFTGRSAIFLNPPFSRELERAYTTGRIKVNGQWVEHEKDEAKARAMGIENWAAKCWEESRKGCTIVAVMPFAPQTDWYRKYVYGHGRDHDAVGWSGHAAQQERRLPHRISFLTPDGQKSGNAGVNSAIIVWSPMRGVVGPWQPHSFYWTYRGSDE